jgi:hypothetical protein
MKIGAREFQSDNLTGTQWVGIVEDNADPLFEGRCKVRVHGKLDGRADPSNPDSEFNIPTDKLPWARPGNINTGGSATGGGILSCPKIDSIVQVTFDNGDLYSPTYHYNIYPSDELKAEIEPSYTNAHSVLYDSEAQPGPVKLFFTEEKGLMLDYNGSQINIRPDNTIYIEHAGGKVIHIQNDHISIGTEDKSDEPAVLGEKNVDALNALADQINALSQSITQFTTAQAAITSAIFFLVPLTPALTALGAAQIPIQTQIQAPIKAATIPQTRSSQISLDGPPML